MDNKKDMCKQCFYICNAKHFQRDFKNWTSGNNYIDKLIQDTQLSAHNNTAGVIEWIPYNRLYNIEHIVSRRSFGKLYRANWIDGCIQNWSEYKQNWKRVGHNRFVILEILNDPNSVKLKFANKIKKTFGITQDPKTKNYMMVLNNICKNCNKRCCAIYFQLKFIDWTSGNEHIDKLIQDTQLSAHYNAKEALEWISYDRLYDIKCIEENKFGKVYRANWIDGNIIYWDNKNKNLKRNNLNMFVNLKGLDAPNNLTLEFINKIKMNHEFYGITQDPEAKIYMIVLNNICEKCNEICNAIYFQRKFIDWTSGNEEIDKFIQDTQISTHYNVEEALEWIPYDRLYNVKYIEENKFGKVYRANWVDGKMSYWEDKKQNWKRKDCNMFVNLNGLITPNNLTLEFINKIKINHELYGITQDQETKNYIIVLDDICEKCNKICSTIYFQRKFMDWTSGNEDIDKIIQNTQLLAHNNADKALEWIPYNRLYNIKYIEENKFGKVCRANWMDGKMSYWDDEKQNWKREGCDMFVNLISLNIPNNLILEFINKIKINYEFYGIIQDPKTKNYMIVLDNICGKCSKICNAIHFQRKFIDWTSGNEDIDKFIQDTQISAHYNAKEALEWISYDRLHNIKYIDKEIYIANWIDGKISYWDNDEQNWKREGCNMFVNLKNLNISNNSNNLTLEFINKFKMNHELYGITQDSETKNYMIVLDDICEKCSKICNATHFQQKFIDWTSGNKDIDKFIQDTQLSVHKDNEMPNALEWMPYERFYNIKYIEKIGISRANLVDGRIYKWDDKYQNWSRNVQKMVLNIKSLNNSKEITIEFMNEVQYN
uniref:Protein kinase domain-containing protein n=1 Tax=Rhizophagus irregularis (strain DAOM 181602 / DAOM 197198 / MUCL 43194) TaxID=747089 RepID=U9TGP8_RHIID